MFSVCWPSKSLILRPGAIKGAVHVPECAVTVQSLECSRYQPAAPLLARKILTPWPGFETLMAQLMGLGRRIMLRLNSLLSKARGRSGRYSWRARRGLRTRTVAEYLD